MQINTASRKKELRKRYEGLNYCSEGSPKIKKQTVLHIRSGKCRKCIIS
jgi:hypothetical protein